MVLAKAANLTGADREWYEAFEKYFSEETKRKTGK
jgi:hypothetical protein